MVVRFGATFVAIVVRMALAFTSGVLVARALGAPEYGRYQFLLASFAAIAQFLDLGSAFAFFTFLSRRRRSWRFLMAYSAWMAVQFTTIVLLVGVLLPWSVVDRMWLGQDRLTLLLAFAAAFLMNEMWEMVTQLAEARRRTVVVQGATTAQAGMHLLLVSLALFFGVLSVRAVLVFLAFEYGALIAIFGPRFLRENVAAPGESGESLGAIGREFVAYCRPLVIYSLVSVVCLFGDRWLLQRFGGAEQQAFFSIAQQIATISLIATTSVLQVFWKEIAEASHAENEERLEQLYGSVSRTLFFAGAWLSCALIPYAREILLLTAGPGYAGARLSLTLMLIFPVYQSMGRIGGSYFYASGDTATYSRIGGWINVVGLPLTYLLVAPAASVVPGIHLGALGLTAKTVAITVLSVNVQHFFIVRANGWSRLFRFQALTLGGLLVLASVCRVVAYALDGWGTTIGGVAVVPIGLGSALYMAISAGVTWRAADAIGLPRRQLLHAVGF